MTVKFTRKGAVLIVKVYGELDHHTAEYFRQKIDSEIVKSTTRDIIFDFSKLDFMDSSGIGVLMGRYKNLIQLKGRAAIVNPNKQIRRILEMSGILKIMKAYNTNEEALEEFNIE
ncbi:MAG TPA: anti-sigma F factor antagonist [Clostridiaceae bacterium]|nr:anti-sigma F factor antagonist [Clostridiaceae bacterium]